MFAEPMLMAKSGLAIVIVLSGLIAYVMMRGF